MEELLARDTGQTQERIHVDTQRDNFMTSEQAKEYGLVDRVVSARDLADDRRRTGLG